VWWIFYYRFTTNLLLSLSVKEFENWSAFGKVSGKNVVTPFFQTRCIQGGPKIGTIFLRVNLTEY